MRKEFDLGLSGFTPIMRASAIPENGTSRGSCTCCCHAPTFCGFSINIPCSGALHQPAAFQEIIRFGSRKQLEAGADPKVVSLVYVAARAPDAGEDYAALAKQFPSPPASAGIVWSGDYGQLAEEAFLRDFAGDLPAEKARVLYAVQEPFKRPLLAGRTAHAAWRSKPSWYAVSTEDRTINPELQRFMAKRMGAKTIEVKASHLSLISQPDVIAKLILEAAGKV